MRACALRRMFYLNLFLIACIGSSGALDAREINYDPSPRPPPGSAVPEAEDLRSQDGVLNLAMTVRNFKEKDGSTRYCYLRADGTQSPTLRLKPGELQVARVRGGNCHHDSLIVAPEPLLEPSRSIATHVQPVLLTRAHQRVGEAAA